MEEQEADDEEPEAGDEKNDGVLLHWVFAEHLGARSLTNTRNIAAASVLHSNLGCSKNSLLSCEDFVRDTERCV